MPEGDSATERSQRTLTSSGRSFRERTISCYRNDQMPGRNTMRRACRVPKSVALLGLRKQLCVYQAGSWGVCSSRISYRGMSSTLRAPGLSWGLFFLTEPLKETQLVSPILSPILHIIVSPTLSNTSLSNRERYPRNKAERSYLVLPKDILQRNT